MLRADARLQVVSLQVILLINPATGCHYFPPGPWLPSRHT